jgi:hypothetical protein
MNLFMQLNLFCQFLVKQRTSAIYDNISHLKWDNFIMLHRAIFSVRSRFPVKLKAFYCKLGVSWQTVVIRGKRYDFFLAGNLFILLSGHCHNKSSTSFGAYDINNELLNVISDKGVVFGEMCSYQDAEVAKKLLGLTVQQIKKTPMAIHGLVPVIRVPSIDKTIEQLATLGSWVKEKHGDRGVSHFCLAQNGLTLEVYPQRKLLLSDNQWELVFATSVSILSESSSISDSDISSVTVDPDGSIVTILKSTGPWTQ